MKNESGVEIRSAVFCVETIKPTGCVYSFQTTKPLKPGETDDIDGLLQTVRGFPAHTVRAVSLRPASRLDGIHKIVVDKIEGNSGEMMREKLVAVLANSRRFTVVEDPTLADATINGRAESRESASAVTASEKGMANNSLAGLLHGAKLKAVTETVITKALVLRLTLRSGEILWAWADSKGCSSEKGKCAIENLVSATY